MEKRGKFIVFEGGEGCGKTTQLQRTQQWLIDSGWLEKLQQSTPIVSIQSTREPGGTALCQKIRQVLLTPDLEPMQDRTELLLYAADRAQHVTGYLHPLLAQGTLILCDRYTDSTVAYQGYGRGLDLTLIHQLNAIATEGLVPDLTLWLDLDVELGLARAQARGSRDRIEQADFAFHQRVRQGFTELHQAHPDSILRIDAAQPIDAVSQAIQTVLETKLTQWYAIPAICNP
ncbi:MAG: dTMP kinase [Alkalinema sp. CACIAM 70d]|nr:MAG: dTMP kinase [Alkalinema sp. CACIAM 70d]